MATGIPRTDSTLSHERVRLQYKGKKPASEIVGRPPARFQQVHTGTPKKRLYFGDNLDVLTSLVSDSSICGNVTLVYIDPPFATQSAFLSRKQQRAYADTLTGAHFVEFLRARIILLRELLADNGSLFLHLDEKMIFEMKLVMDEVFGPGNYRNMIVRKKCNPKNYTRKAYGNIADFILFYTKTDKYLWNRPVEPLSEVGTKEYHYVEPETGRRFMKVPIHAPGTRNGATGEPWRGRLPPPGKHWQYLPKTLDEMDARGEIFWSENGNPRRKVYLDDHPGAGVQDIWLDFKDAHNQNIKITGYPTEKNPELLRRIVAASSNPGDIVLDCFAGSGTTLAVADEMQRNWIGADNSLESLKTILGRFERGLQAMGDYVEKEADRGGKGQEQPTLFESLEASPNRASLIEDHEHKPITDFMILVARDRAAEAKSVVSDWRNRILPAGIKQDNYCRVVSEGPEFADICYRLHARDSRLAKIIDSIGPCALKSNHAGFEFLVDAIIGQQLSKIAADTINHRFRKRFRSGRPTPKSFLAKPKKTLLEAGVSQRKYEYITDLCRKIEDGTLRLLELQDEDDDVIRNSLKTVKGIGDWTVDMYLLFGLARLDVFPVHDLALRRIMCEVYKVPQDDLRRLERISSHWKPYRSVGSWYLYKYANMNA